MKQKQAMHLGLKAFEINWTSCSIFRLAGFICSRGRRKMKNIQGKWNSSYWNLFKADKKSFSNRRKNCYTYFIVEKCRLHGEYLMEIKKIIIKLDNNIDETLAKLGIILGLLGTILSAILSGGFYILALSTSFICLLYLYLKRIFKK